MLIVVSTVFTWANTQKSGTVLTDADFSKRVPFPKFQQTKLLENLAITASKFHKKLRTHVICSGLLYGNGEANDGFYEFFRRAWISLHPELAALPVVGDGKNNLPTVHVRDLSRFVIALTEESAQKIQKPYLIAVDLCKHSTQAQILKTISQGLGSGALKNVSLDQVLDEEWAETLTLDLKF